jgi:hypothetical protein
MEEVEKKIEGLIEFIFVFIKTIVLFFIPGLLIKQLRKDKPGVTRPYIMLGIFAFFGTRLWLFLSMIIAVAFFNGCDRDGPATMTVPDEPSVLDFLNLPSLEDLFFVSIPYMLIVIISVKGYAAVFNFFKLSFQVSIESVLLYVLTFFTLMAPVLTICAVLVDQWWLYVLISLLVFLYTGFMLNRSLSRPVKSALKSYIVTSFAAVVIPLMGAYVIYFTLKLNDSLPRQLVHNLPEKDYFEELFFEAMVTDYKQDNDSIFMEVLMCSNDNEDHTYFILPNDDHDLMAADTSIVGYAYNVRGDLSVSTAEPSLIYIEGVCNHSFDSQKTYVMFNVIDETSWEAKSICVRLSEFGSYD